MPKAINGAISERRIEFFRLNFPLRNETINEKQYFFRLSFSNLYWPQGVLLPGCKL